MDDYILIGTSSVICLASMIISSRKSGYIVGYKIPFRDKYDFDKTALEDYCKIMLLIIACCFVVGSFFSQDVSTVFAFTAMNTAFIGYALAWEKIIKLRQ